MVNQIDPRTQYILYEERSKQLDLAIERRLARQAREEMGAAKPAYPWYVQVAHWFKERIPVQAFQKPAITESAHLKEPCPGIPC